MGRYFEEFTVGEKVVAPPRAVTVAEVQAFAALTGDVNRLHLDDDYARAQGFRQRIAHGALVLSVALGMAWQTGILEDTTRAFREIETWKFTSPAYPGDVLSLVVEVTALKPYPRLKSGTVSFLATVTNDRGETVCGGTLHLLMAMRPGA
jgi:acyl dehydratase